MNRFIPAKLARSIGVLFLGILAAQPLPAGEPSTFGINIVILFLKAADAGEANAYDYTITVGKETRTIGRGDLEAANYRGGPDVRFYVSLPLTCVGQSIHIENSGSQFNFCPKEKDKGKSLARPGQPPVVFTAHRALVLTFEPLPRAKESVKSVIFDYRHCIASEKKPDPTPSDDGRYISGRVEAQANGRIEMIVVFDQIAGQFLLPLRPDAGPTTYDTSKLRNAYAPDLNQPAAMQALGKAFFEAKLKEIEGSAVVSVSAPTL